MKTCPECGGRVYSRGCVNCDEDAYITEQEALTDRYNSERPRYHEVIRHADGTQFVPTEDGYIQIDPL
jgi:hypothetical protein